MPMHIFENTAADFRSGLASNKHNEITTCSGFYSVEQWTFLTEAETCDTVLEWIRLWFSAANDYSFLSQKTPVRKYMMGQYCLGYTQRMHEHTPTCPCTSMRLTWETLGKSPGFWHHTRRDLLTMARGDWGTENRTRSVNSSCAQMLPFKIWSFRIRRAETHRHKQIHIRTWDKDKHAHLPGSAIFSPLIFCNHFVIKRDIQLLCSGRECLLFLNIHNYKCGQVEGTENDFTHTFIHPPTSMIYSFLQFALSIFQIHTLHAGWFSLYAPSVL